MNPYIIFGLIIIAIILIILLVALVIIPALTKNDDKLANQPANQIKHDHSKNCVPCQIASQPINAMVTEKCIVTFRPHPNWKGEYGFDWLREKDTGFTGDKKDYKEIIGKYGNKYASDLTPPLPKLKVDTTSYESLRKAYYNPFSIGWKKDKNVKVKIYATPYLSLFPQDQCADPWNDKRCAARLKVYIEVEGHDLNALRFEYDKTLFVLTPNEIPPSMYFKGCWEFDLTVTCIKEFDDDQEINVFPYKYENFPGVEKFIDSKRYAC